MSLDSSLGLSLFETSLNLDYTLTVDRKEADFSVHSHIIGRLTQLDCVILQPRHRLDGMESV